MNLKLKKVVSFLSALALMTEFINPVCYRAQTVVQEQMGELTSVIVRIKDEQSRDEVEKYIKGIYPDFETKFNYSIAFSGFSCQLPENLIPDVKKYPLVESISPVSVSKVPNLGNVKDFIGVSGFLNQTQCRGEGKVIAIIDTEFDLSHNMFSAIDDKNNRITIDDIRAISESEEYNCDASLDELYVNSKVPFAYDYVDGELADIDNFHGTHVAGIAAGNIVAYDQSEQVCVDLDSQNDDTILVSGIAPDAQLVLMGAGCYSEDDGMGMLSDDAIIAAMEDAIRLKVDIINMSFGAVGEHFLDNPLLLAIDAAEEAGIVVCKAAGNEGPADNSPNNPQYGSKMTREGVLSSVFCVANAEKDMSMYVPFNENDYVEFDGQRVYIGEICYSGDEIFDFCSLHNLAKTGNYEAVTLNSTDFSSSDVENKIVFIDNEVIDIDTVQKFSEKLYESKAVALIVFKDSVDDIEIEYDTFDGVIPTAYMETRYYNNIMDSVNAGKEFIITIPDFNYNDSRISDFSTWGVTSSLELAPDIAGIGEDLLSAAYYNSLCYMSGTSMASPCIAGCVAITEEYLEKNNFALTGKEKSKFVKNIMRNSADLCTDNVTYVSPRCQGSGVVNLTKMLDDKVLLTGKSGDAELNIYDELGDTFSFDVNISNISSEDVHFTNAELVLLTDDSADVMFYGQKIEGSQVLKSSADLSAVMDINAGENRMENITVSLDPEQTANILETFINGFFVEGYIVLSGAENCCDISVPVFGYYGKWNNQSFIDIYNNNNNNISLIKSIEEFVKNGESDYYENISYSDGIYISPDENGFNDYKNMNVYLLSNCFTKTDVIRKTDNEVILSYDNLRAPMGYLYGEDLDIEFEDGEYTERIKANNSYWKSVESPEIFEFNFIADSTAPQGYIKEIEKNGRKYLSIEASDENLDGFIIIGKNKKESSGNKYYNNSVDIISNMLYVNTDLEFMRKNHSDIENLIGHSDFIPDSKEYDFLDAVSSKDGKISLVYDITDLEYYSAAVMDKAYNMITQQNIVISTNIKPGIWALEDFILYTADGVTGKLINPVDSSESYFEIREEDGEYIFYDTFYTSELSRAGKIEFFRSERIMFYNDEKGYMTNMTYISDKNIDNYFLYTDNEIKSMMDKLSSRFSNIDFENTSVYCYNAIHYDKRLENNDLYISLFTKRNSGLCNLGIRLLSSYQYFNFDIPMYIYDESRIIGDVDGNGVLNSGDIMELQKIIIDNNKEIPYMLADVNNDASINAMDIFMLREAFLIGKKFENNIPFAIIGSKLKDQLVGKIDIDTANLRTYTTSYITEDIENPEYQWTVEDDWNVVLTRLAISRGCIYGEFYDADDNDYYGWMDINKVKFEISGGK